MRMCLAENCASLAVAKGYCRKHYMRLRRHGDAQRINKAGRPKLATPASHEAIEGIISSLAEVAKPSARTIARYQRALRLIHETATLTGDDPGDLHERAVRLLAETGARRAITPKGLEDYAFSRWQIAKVVQELRPIPKTNAKKPVNQEKKPKPRQQVGNNSKKAQADFFQN